MTRLVGVVVGPTVREASQQIEGLLADVDLLELRLDFFDEEELGKIKELSRAKPWVMTFRKRESGGGKDIEEIERLKRLKGCLKLEPEYCDLEVDTDLAFIEEVVKKYPKMELIGSRHLKTMPKNLEEVVSELHQPHFAHYKLAVACSNVNEALQLLLIGKGRERLSTVAMGMEGQVSRILSPVMGSEFCYATANV